MSWILKDAKGLDSDGENDASTISIAEELAV